MAHSGNTSRPVSFRCLPYQVDGGRDPAAFLVFGEPGVIGPTIAVAADVPIAGGDRGGGGRVGLERAGAAENCHRQPKAVEDAMEPPEADPRAIFEHALGAEVAARHAQIGADHLGQAAFRDAVAAG